MVQAVTFILVRSVFGAVLGMFYFGFNTGVVNAPEAAIRHRVFHYTGIERIRYKDTVQGKECT